MCSEILLSTLRPIFSLHPPDLVHFARLLCHSATLSVFKMNLVSVLCVLFSLLSLCVFPCVSLHRVTWDVMERLWKTPQNKTSTAGCATQKNSRFYKNCHWVDIHTAVCMGIFFSFIFFKPTFLASVCVKGFFSSELKRLLGFSEVKVTFEQLFMALFYFSP